jgi:hypothetical protein
MNTRAMVIIAVSILAARSNRKSNQTLTLTLNKEALKAFADKSNVAKLATQLEKIHYQATVTIEGETVSTRISQAPIRDVRRAVCHRMRTNRFMAGECLPRPLEIPLRHQRRRAHSCR